MTIVVPESPKKAGRPKGSHGNGKTMAEIAGRERRKLAVIEFERRADEARSNASDISKITELRAQQRERKFELYAHQESKRAPQAQIDQRPTLWFLGFLAGVMFLATAALTADGTIGAAATAQFSIDWFGFLLFGAIEVSVLAFMLIYYVNGSRVDYEGNPEPATRWFVAMIAASTVAAGLSVYHAVDLYDFDVSSIEMWVGIVIRLTSTIFFVLISKGIASVIFAKAVRF
jgi:hypothetical protein